MSEKFVFYVPGYLLAGAGGSLAVSTPIAGCLLVVAGTMLPYAMKAIRK